MTDDGMETGGSTSCHRWHLYLVAKIWRCGTWTLANHLVAVSGSQLTDGLLLPHWMYL